MYQQYEVVHDGLEYMTLSAYTADSHRNYCTKLGIFQHYGESVKAGTSIGGDGEEESRRHLLSRYLNSASRTQAIVCIENEKCEHIQTEVLTQLESGELHVIDIAAGHGAGTVSLLNTICDMRRSKALKTAALDVSLHAIDYSSTSLVYYAEILESLRDTYASYGVFVTFHPSQVDITNDEAMALEIGNIKARVGENPQYLLICSAISGVKEQIFRQKFYQSYELISKSFSEENSIFLWVEPRSPRSWMHKIWLEFYDKYGLDFESDASQNAAITQQKYSWIDPHNHAKMNEKFYDYCLLKLA